MNDFRPLIVDEKYLAGRFGSAVAAGSRLARDGHVLTREWSESGLELSGTCDDPDGYSYAAQIRFLGTPGGGRQVVGSQCSCPLTLYCKHAVAVMLDETAANRHVSGGVVPGWRTALDTVAQTRGSTAVSPVATPSRARVGLLFILPDLDDARDPGLRILPVVTDALGRWRPSVTWDQFGDSSTADFEYDDDASPLVPEHVRAARTLARAAIAAGAVDDETACIVVERAPEDIWDLLTSARDAGIALMADPDEAASTVEIVHDAELGLHVERDGDGIVLRAGLRRAGGHSTVDSHEKRYAPPFDGYSEMLPHGFFLVAEQTLFLGSVAASVNKPAVAELVDHSTIRIPDADVPEFRAEVLPALQASLAIHDPTGALDAAVARGPFPLLTVEGTDQGSLVYWQLCYEIDGTQGIFERNSVRMNASFRDMRAEADLWEPLADTMRAVASTCNRWPMQAVRYAQHEFMRAGATREASYELLKNMIDPEKAISQATPELLARRYTYSRVDTARLCGEVVPGLRQRPDVRVRLLGIDTDFRAAQTEPIITFGLGDDPRSDWFNLRIHVSIDGQAVPYDVLLRELRSSATHMIMPDGTYFPLDHPSLERLVDLLDEARDIGDIQCGRIRRGSVNATLWEELFALGVVDADLTAWSERLVTLAQATPPTPADTPAALRAELRDYQRDGLTWLKFLWDNKIGGILADDMGLGKTIQTLALIATALETTPDARFLVIAPTSVVGNWVKETERFLPDTTIRAISSVRTHGPVDEQIGDSTIAVTSYTLFRLQYDTFAEFPWSVIIFDEAQFLKNHDGKTHQCARRIPADLKLAITGTPMENNLMELWALLSITTPGLFPTPRHFIEFFRRPIESGDRRGRLALLRRRIKPVMLRRTKDQVVGDLPPKQEQTVALDLSPRHEKIYRARFNREQQKVLGLIEDFEQNRFEIFRSLTMLRQLSLHAALVDDQHADVPSSKIDYLADKLPELVEEGHSALVFSQFTGFLNLVRRRLDEVGVPYSYLDGSMSAPARATEIDRFTSGTTRVFLISLKAGGFGLNLTEADYCFVCDPWWNPAAEAQAVDRAHRIGQTRPVTVYRLVSAGTVEETVVALQERKRALFDAVIDDGDLFGTAITAGDIRDLMGKGDG